MNQANTWQRLAVGQALREDKLDLDQDIIQTTVRTGTVNDQRENSCYF